MMNKDDAIVRVGVSGHRFLDDEISLEESVRQVMGEIYSRHNQAQFHLYSPLAAGADQLFARCGLAHPKTYLIVILPLPKSIYLRYFTEAQQQNFGRLFNQAKKVITLPDSSDRDAAYLAAGKYVVDYSDYLVALWNGKPALGNGGTAQVVEYALGKKKPTAWIRAHNALPGKPIRLDAWHEQGSIEYFNWDNLPL